MPVCPYCNNRIESSWKVCPSCGSPLAAGTGAVASRAGTKPVSGQPTGAHGGGPVRWSKTMAAQIGGPSALTFTFMEGGQVLAQREVPLGKDTAITFGRAGCDLLVNPPSQTVSSRHGAIVVRHGQCFLKDLGSSNGIYLNGVKQPYCRVGAGDVIVIGPPRQGQVRTVIVVGDASMHLSSFDLSTLSVVRVGRVEGNELFIPNPTLSPTHAVLTRTTAGWYIEDARSSNGTKVNGVFVSQPTPLLSGSMIVMGNAQAVFLDSCLLLFSERQGVDVNAERLVRYRGRGRRRRVTTDHISLHIKRGEFVAIVGGSGSAKSTLLNELSGTEPADEGSVSVDGTDLYANYELLKTSIGYVPQQDIVYDDLTVESMLLSAAKLRMTPDATRKERRARVNEIISLLELDGVRHNLIGNLSGGQKKRASIGVELLADPRLLFLDEPTSGLDPGIERKLMQTLADMAHDGRTIILVTHTTLNLHLCDQVVFLGYGGKLCYAGRPAGALSFFGVDDFVDVYNKIEENPDGWQQAFVTYSASDPAPVQAQLGAQRVRRKMPHRSSQFRTLSARYVRLILHDRSRLALLLLQGPILAAVISFVASGNCFAIYEKGKSCLFALSCAAFWVGIFNSIQEVCKERDIFLREYGGGVRLGAYVASKVVVLGLLCVLQAAMLCAVFFGVTELLGKAGGSLGAGCILESAQLEVWVSCTLLTLSAMCLGLLVSSLFDNPDRAIALAPLLIMPQILFAGVVYKMDQGSVSDYVSYAVNCRWGMEALGTSFDLDDMDLAMYGKEISIAAQDQTVTDIEVSPDEIGEIEVSTSYGTQKVKPTEPVRIAEKSVHMDAQTKKIDASMLAHDPQDLDNGMFAHTKVHLLRAWGILAGFSVICVAACHWVLRKSVRR